jgi:DNA-binding HxlR family transcriptional regulator
MDRHPTNSLSARIAPGEIGVLNDRANVVCNKWSMAIIVSLGRGTLRFNEIRRELEPVTQKTLVLALRRLEDQGLITRTEFDIKPPRVDYALTSLGQSLWDIVFELDQWMQIHGVAFSREKKE